MNSEFSKFKIGEALLKSIEGLGYNTPSEVQEKVIPEILMNNDVIVKSQTGSGKTAAFGIPLCEKIDWNENSPQVLVLTPTRELAVQVSEDISNIGRFKRISAVAIYGKEPISDQKRKLKQKTHIVVGTPGRILDHIDKGSLDVSKIKYFVIDEADEMLNMGFIDQVENVIKMLPKKKVTMLFSATMPDEIKKLCQKHMNKPVDISIKSQKLITENIEHTLYYVNYEKKLENLNSILIYEKPETAIIFARTQENVDKIFEYLNAKKYSTNKIHGGMLQKERLSAMEDFRRGDFRLLIATDVASRGIDVDGITHVINFDLPVEKEAYVHRTGRTGRAGAKGKAISFCIKEKDNLLNDIENLIGFKIPICYIPGKEELEKVRAENIELLKSKPKRKKEKAKIINTNITKIYLNGGKKKKLRAGDIVGAICKIDGITADDIGIIDVQDSVSYVDILNGKGANVIKELKNMTIKGKKITIEKSNK